MMESSNLRTGISASLLRTIPAALAEIPQHFYPPQREPIGNPMRFKFLPRTVQRNRHRWLVDANLTQIRPQVVAFNPRQWLLSANPRLTKLITSAIGDRWMTHLEDLEQLTPIADDALFQSRWQTVKQENKQELASELYRSQGIEIDPNSLFDLQLQPFSGHQRQLLNILNIINLFDRIKQNPDIEMVPRTFIFGDLDEAAAGIDAAENVAAQPDNDLNRSILALIKSLAAILAADRDIRGKLQIVYIPDSAGLTSQLYAAADLTQQIATAAIEDVDLSKLKASINGVLSIGSLGKTNYWLQQTVGEHNCFRFGLAIPEIALFKEYGYDPYNYYKYYPQIRQAIDRLFAGHFTPDDVSLGRAIVERLLDTDEHMVLADYIFYTACQSHVSETYARPSLWTRMSILNVAGVK
jgi:glycogen phosphorylase